MKQISMSAPVSVSHLQRGKLPTQLEVFWRRRAISQQSTVEELSRGMKCARCFIAAPGIQEQLGTISFDSRGLVAPVDIIGIDGQQPHHACSCTIACSFGTNLVDPVFGVE